MKSTQILASLKALLGPQKVRTEFELLQKRAHDSWMLDLQRRLHGGRMSTPLCVVQPATTSDVAAVLAFASREKVAIVPYGAGSGVCGGARSENDQVVLDLSNMKALIALNEKSLTVTVEPGMLGAELERLLNERGYSMGHFPQSMNLSSVGGWVATRASGQYSTKYGSIENMLVCLQAVLADGAVIETRNVPRASCGPNLNELFLGSEGILAVVTQVTYKIHPLPERAIGLAYQLPSMRHGLEAIRKILRAGWKPALVRLYDPSETKRHFPGTADSGTSMLLTLAEGPAAYALAEAEAMRSICLEEGALFAGEEPVKHWLEKRFVVPDLMAIARDKGAVFDTIEVSANWDQAAALYDAVIEALNSVPGIVVASAHSSHSYQQGTCLYFTFAAKKPRWLLRQALQVVSWQKMGQFTAQEDLQAVEETYNLCWSKVMAATLAHQGTISHHHGVGKVRLPWMEKEHATTLCLLRKVKDAVDPGGILNPGTLLPPSSKS